MLPKEHGAWNVLAISLIAGWLALGSWTWAGLAATGLWSFAFVLRGPWNTYRQYRSADPKKGRRAWVFLLLAASLALVSGILFLRMAPPLARMAAVSAGLPLGVVLGALAVARRNLRSWPLEVLGFLGVTLAVPVIFLTGPLATAPQALWLYGLFAGYFLLAMALVHLRQSWNEGVRQGRRLSEGGRLAQGWWILLAFALWVEMLGDGSGGRTILILSPLYAALRGLLTVLWGRAGVPMMRLGLGEMVHSVIFLAIWYGTWWA